MCLCLPFWALCCHIPAVAIFGTWTISNLTLDQRVVKNSVYFWTAYRLQAPAPSYLAAKPNLQPTRDVLPTRWPTRNQLHYQVGQPSPQPPRGLATFSSPPKRTASHALCQSGPCRANWHRKGLSFMDLAPKSSTGPHVLHQMQNSMDQKPDG